MRFAPNLERWLGQLLPGVGPCAQQAALTVVRALLVSYRTTLADLARQSDRPGTVKSRRQWLARWLARPHWQPETIYAQLNRQARRLLDRRGDVPLRVDFTDLGTTWRVLQVSVAWRGGRWCCIGAWCITPAPRLDSRNRCGGPVPGCGSICPAGSAATCW